LERNLIIYFDPSIEFKAAFNLAMSYYGCGVEEARYEKKRIMESALAYHIAEQCYLKIAEEIKENKV